uniref:C2 domain-containing protein n=1 Tax=Salix viminalis TaxID=40686 RepID=A0A6N2MIJ1_SALVM
MSKFPSSKLQEPTSSSAFESKEQNGTIEMDDHEDTMASVARFIEKLHSRLSSPPEKELVTARLLCLAQARKEARTVIGSHAQAMPLFISILRSGTSGAKVNVAATLSALCKDDDLRVKVLLGGCIPPLLSLLKSESIEARKAAAEAIYEVSSGSVSDDQVGIKIFATEGVTQTLWEQLNPKNKQDKVVQGFVTGALRNLCGDKDNYWRAMLEAGGVNIIVGLLSSDNAAAQSNAASLLARLMLAFGDSIPKVIDSGAVQALLQLVGQNNDISVRASAADALEALSSKSTKAKKAIVDADGIPILIGAIVAPSKECMQGEFGQALQGHATRALANICSGMSALILYLGELSQSPRLAAPVADIIGALAYALMVFEQNAATAEETFDATKIEDILVKLLKPRDNKLVQERVLEAMASLYGNIYLSICLDHAEAKKVLIGLITMAVGDPQEYLILSLTSLCCDGVGIWDAIGKREGIQLLISLLGLSSEQHQEFGVRFLAILTDQVDDTVRGRVQEREDAAHILWNLCCHSEDIRACVESAGAVPAFLWLLKSGGPKGQEASAMALTRLVQTADSTTINQLLALLLGDSSGSKAHTIRVLGHVLTMASHKDLVQRGSAANQALRSLIKILNSSNEETQESAASVLADLFTTRQDICDSLATDEIVHPCMKLLTSNNTQVVATQLARALGALSRPTKTKNTMKMPYISEGDVKPLIKLAKTSIDAAETAIAALANLLSDPQIAAEALADDVVGALTRVLGEGTSEGKKNASRALHQLLSHFPVGDVLGGNAQCRFSVLAILNSLNSMSMDGTDITDALEVVALLVKMKHGVNFTYLPRAVLSEVTSSLDPLARLLAEGPPLLQDKAIEILSQLCGDQPGVLGDLLIARSSSIDSLANRIINSSSLEVKIGGITLLICAAKEHIQQSVEALDVSGYLKPLIYALVNMMKQNSCYSSLEMQLIVMEAGGLQRLSQISFSVILPLHRIAICQNLVALSEEFSLYVVADQVILEHLFAIEDVRLGSTCTQIYSFVGDLLRPIPDRPGSVQLPLNAYSPYISHQSDNSRLWNLLVCALRDWLDDELKVELAAAYVKIVGSSCWLGFWNKSRDLLSHRALHLKLTPSQVIEPLISFLESPSQAIQQLGTELLSHLLAQEHFQQDITTKNAVVPLVQLAGIGILNLQQTAIKALEKISISWPKVVADAGGIFELAKVIIQDDPQPPVELWETAALVLSNVLHVNAEYYFKVPMVVLVKMLHSTCESTIKVALNGLIVHERTDASSAEQMTEGDWWCYRSLLNLLRSHQCEELSGTLLEALFNHIRVREKKASSCNSTFITVSVRPTTPDQRLAGCSLKENCGPQQLSMYSSENLECHIRQTFLKLMFLKQPPCAFPIFDIVRSQAMIAAEAIPILQMLMKTCPPSFHERADLLLHCLPGCLTVTINRGNNLKQAMGTTNAFCRLTIGNGPPRQTKVVSHSISPEWKEGFTWAFDVPPKGQKLHIICKSKNTFGKNTLGRVTIQIDKVVSEGVYSGLFSLNHDSNKDGSSRTLEIEIVWTNRTSE